MKKTGKWAVCGLFAAVLLWPLNAAGAQSGDFQLQTTTLPTVAPGACGWMHVYWQGGPAVAENVSVTIGAPAGYTVTYPRDGQATSLAKDAVLSPGEVDYTAFKLTVPLLAWESPLLVANVSYRVAGIDKTEALKILLPLERNPTGDFELLTESIGPIARGMKSWASFYFRGATPLYDVRLTVTDSQTAQILYPDEGTFSSFMRDANLAAGETDYIAFRLDTTGLASSLFLLGLELDYATDPAGVTRKRVPLTALLVVGDEMWGSGERPRMSLTTDKQRLSLADAEQRVTFFLDAGETHAGKSYRLLGSVSGTSQGVTIGEVTVPLNVDSYLMYTLENPNAGPLIDSAGLLDIAGRAIAGFRLSGSLPGNLAGFTFYHAFVVLGDSGLEFASNWAPLTFVE